MDTANSGEITAPLSHQYYYLSNKAILGPVSFGELQGLVLKQKLLPHDRVWIDTFEGADISVQELNLKLPESAPEPPPEPVLQDKVKTQEISPPLLFHPNFRPNMLLPDAGLAPKSARSQYRYTDIRFQKNLAISLLVLNIALSLFFAYKPDTFLFPFIIIVGLFMGITYLTWLYQAVSNAHSFGGRDLFFSPAGAVASYFMPLFNLFRPYQALQELWKASSNPANWKNYDENFSVIAYWLFHWLSIATACSMGYERIQALKINKLAGLQNANHIQSLSLVLASCSMALLCVIISQITSAQYRQAQQNYLPKYHFLPLAEEVFPPEN